MRIPVASFVCVLLLGTGCARTLTDYGLETICELHREPLQKDVVPIVYGLVSFPPDERKALKDLFPNSCMLYYAGAVVRRPVRARIKFCPKCRAAEVKWRRNRPLSAAKRPTQPEFTK